MVYVKSRKFFLHKYYILRCFFVEKYDYPKRARAKCFGDFFRYEDVSKFRKNIIKANGNVSIKNIG